MPSYFFWKMRATPGACIKPGCFARCPLCHKANLLSCVARRPLLHEVNLPWSSAAPFHHDLWYFWHWTNEHFSSVLFFRKNVTKKRCQLFAFQQCLDRVVQRWVKITQEKGVRAKFEFRSESFILSTSWWLDALKNNGENYPKKCFWTKDKGNLG